MAYATVEELEEFLKGTPPSDSERLLDRASELIDRHLRYKDERWNPGTGQPHESQTQLIESLRKATCAQVEWWIEVGDEKGVLTEAHRGGATSVQIGKTTLPTLPHRLGPRARDFLYQEGLLYAGVRTGTPGGVVGNRDEDAR